MSSARTKTPALPRMIAELRLLAPLGRGGMGEVWAAHDTLLDRSVAVKVLHDGGADGGLAAALVEARAAARIQHPNVAAIYRVVEEDGRMFIVSELVHGDALDMLPRPIGWRKALDLSVGLARGLAAAHRRGVLHGDIKPANVIVAEDGTVKLVDFGLARLLDADGSLAEGDDEFVGGTPNYMPPEIWNGQPVTKRSDVYSMGALIFELCAGAPPFAGKAPPDIQLALTRGDPPSVTGVAPDIDPRFADVIDRCLRSAAADRYASAEELCEALESITFGGAAATIPEGNPYRGLLAFEAQHRALFFGRDTEIGTILERLRSDSMVLVAGDSGTGKSSLCRAGIVPRVAYGALDRARSFQTVQMVPGRRPLAALASAVAPLLGVAERDVAEGVRADPDWLRAALATWAARERGALLFVDQLEELITNSDATEAACVSEALGRLSARGPAARLLMSIRGDFLARATALPGLGEELTSALYLLRPLSPAKMREAIVGPARAKSVTFESEALVDALVESTARAEGGLPLLQFALAELWETKLASSTVLTAASLEQIGGVEGALARHADHVLHRLPAAQQASARRILCALVTLAKTRARRTESELVGNDENARAALDALVRGRLLVATEAEGGTAVEIAHEALVTSWFTLRRMLEEQVEARQARDRLENAAARWRQRGRDRELLWGPVDLADAARLDVDFLSAVERDFLAASRGKVAQRKRLRAGLFLLVPLVATSIYAAATLMARRDLDRRVGAHLGEAAAILAATERRLSTLDDVERRAFSAFDHQDREGGERLWTETLSMYSEIDLRYREAAQRIEAALALDGSRGQAREDLARVLHLRVLLAERRRMDALREELTQRLLVHDASGRFRAALDAPARLHVETEPEGAEITLARYETDPSGASIAGPPRSLGQSPADAADVAPGSYLVVLRAPGRAVVRAPVVLARGEDMPLRIVLPRADEVPPRFVYVPAGRFLFGSADDETMRRSFLVTVPLHEVTTGPYLIARHETTFAEWIEFLRALPPDERERRLPRAAEGDLSGVVALTELADGKFRVTLKPSNVSFTAAEGEPIVYASRAEAERQDWLEMPVVGIDLDDIEAYLRWLDRSGKTPGARVCTDHEWERAARGADDRAYPHGRRLSPKDANYYDTHGRDPASVGLDQVGSHPRSTSPFGVDDMAGNVFEWVRSSLAKGEWAIRGGAYYYDTVSARSMNRTPVDQNYRDSRFGLRVCASFPAR